MAISSKKYISIKKKRVTLAPHGAALARMTGRKKRCKGYSVYIFNPIQNIGRVNQVKVKDDWPCPTLPNHMLTYSPFTRMTSSVWANISFILRYYYGTNHVITDN